MRKLLIVFLIVFFSSCATTPSKNNISKNSGSGYINITDFCKKYNFEYSFDTIDDLIRIYSPDKEIKLLLNSSIGVSGGSIIYFKKSPIYLKGEIFLPLQLEKIITSKEFTLSRPLFTVKTIVIDPGHGGKDPGAISSEGLQEKAINLTISKYLKKELERLDFKVILTRDQDTFISLAARTDVAKRNNADLFVSIHANANRSQKVSGVEIYHLSPLRLKALDRSVRLAKSEKFFGKDIAVNVKTILWDLLITKNYGFSVELANIFYLTFKDLGFKVRSPKKAPFYVLRFAYVPSVLVEVGYLSNLYEEKALRKKYYQKRIARAVALAISSLNKRHSVSSNESHASKK